MRTAIKSLLITFICSAMFHLSYGQTGEEFLFKNSTNEVKTMWNELVAIKGSSLAPEELSLQWGTLKKMHSYTLDMSSRYQVSTQLDTLLKDSHDSLLLIYDNLAQKFSFNINRPAFGKANSAGEFRNLSLILLQNEKNILTVFRNKIYQNEKITDLFHYSVTPETQYVAENGWYTASIKVYAYGINVSRARVFVEGKELPVVNGEALLRFRPTCERSQANEKGVCEKKWEGKIVLEGTTPIEFPIEETYYVGRAYMIVQSAAISSLYKGCANYLMISIPALGSAYHPRFEISNPEKNRIIPSTETPGMFTVIPEDDRITISIYNDSVFFGTETFPVRRIAGPDLKIYVDRKPQQSQMILLEAVQSKEMRIQLEADENFKAYLPRDASYELREYSITVTRKGQTVIQENIKTKRKGEILLEKSAIKSKIQRGDIITIKVVSAVRKTFDQREEQVIPMNDIYVELKVE